MQLLCVSFSLVEIKTSTHEQDPKSKGKYEGMEGSSSVDIGVLRKNMQNLRTNGHVLVGDSVIARQPRGEAETCG
jgi:hypothetical protein